MKMRSIKTWNTILRRTECSVLAMMNFEVLMDGWLKRDDLVPRRSKETQRYGEWMGVHQRWENEPVHFLVRLPPSAPNQLKNG